MEFSKVNVHLIIPQNGIRKVLKDILRNLGFTNIAQGSTFEDVESSIAGNQADLLIVYVDFPHGDIQNLIKKVRYGKIGKNPFLPIVSITTRPTKNIVSDVSNSGSDDLLTYPMSPRQLLERLLILINKRKKFVVTSDYIGPDRRTSNKKRLGQLDVPLIDTPNTLEVKLKETMSKTELENAIEKTFETIKSQRLERGSDNISWLIHRVIAGYAWGEGKTLEPEIEIYLRRLNEGAADIAERLDGSEFRHVSYLCEAMLVVTRRLFKEMPKASKVDLTLLDLLSKAFNNIFSTDEDIEFAMQIKGLMDKY